MTVGLVVITRDCAADAFPWQVSLRDGLRSHTCGGSIINQNQVGSSGWTLLINVPRC